ncbi:MAG: hypothetical protein AB7V46_13615 [Thermomicrobiales bacterium]
MAVGVSYASLPTFAFVVTGDPVTYLMPVVNEAALALIRQAEGAAAVKLAITCIANAAQARRDIAIFIGPA